MEVNNIEFIDAVSRSYRELFGGPKKFHKSQKQMMILLSKQLQYDNVILLSLDDWMNLLGVKHRSNLWHRLETVDHLVEKFPASHNPETVPKGHLMVKINPEYAYLTGGTDKEKLLKDFLLFKDLSETSKKDVTLTPYYKSVKDLPDL